MSVSSSSSIHLIPIDPRIYCETMNELHSYITTSKRGYLTQAELFRYYRQRHVNAEIPYRLLGYRSLLDLLSSDQRLFSIDLHREPAYIYSAVKLRQQKRERRQGITSFSRQHHSTNTLEDQYITPPDFIYFDHHVPLNVQQQQQRQNIESGDEHESLIEMRDERPLTPKNSNHFDTNVWHTPQLDEQIPLMEKNMNAEESNEENIDFGSNPFLSLPTVPLTSNVNDSSSSCIKCENQYKPLQRRTISTDDNKRSSTRDPSMLNFSSSRLTHSISTSTTSLTKTTSIQVIDLYIFLLFTVIISFIYFGVYLYRIRS